MAEVAPGVGCRVLGAALGTRLLCSCLTGFWREGLLGSQG